MSPRSMNATQDKHPCYIGADSICTDWRIPGPATEVSELNIPAKLMRIILSTARLHFSYTDERNLSISDLNKVLAAQLKAADSESKFGEDEYFQNACLASTTTKSYIKNWRKRHLGPFFRKTEAVENLRFLSSLDAGEKYTKVKLLLLGSEIFSVDELQVHFAGVN